MDLGVISVRYARALLKCATLEGYEHAIYEDMTCLSKCYIDVPELSVTIANPMLSQENKQKVLESACGKHIHSLTKKFISLVIKEKRENVMQLMAASYITLYREKNKIISGQLITAKAVDATTEAKMKKLIEDKTQATVEFNTQVDPEIIGGFILEYDTYRMDASVTTKLRTILTEFKK